MNAIYHQILRWVFCKILLDIIYSVLEYINSMFEYRLQNRLSL